MKRRLLVALLGVALICAACASGDSGERGFVAKLGAGAAATDEATTEAGADGPVAVGATDAGGAAATAGAAGSPTAAAAAFKPRKVGKMGPGVTDTEVRIGFEVVANLSAGFILVGAEGSPPAEKGFIDALVAWVNRTGGLAGRKLVPIFQSTDPTGGTWSTQAQAACSTFTEDNHVFMAASSVVGGTDALWACMSEKNTPLISQNLWLFDHRYYEQRPGMLYQPGRGNPDRWAKAYVDGLFDAHYFEGNPKVGLVRFDAPVMQRVTNDVVKPAMKAHGLAFTEEASISEPESIAGFSSASSQISNAILRLRAAGVTHVMFIENAGILPFLFMPAAESQGYRPRYGMSSNDIPDTQASQVPPEQLPGSLAVGWLPPSDVGEENVPPGNAAHQKCIDIMKAAGLGNLTGFYVQPPCDTIFFLRTVFDRATDLTNEGIRAAAEQLGTSYNSPLTFTTKFAPGRTDGADSYQIMSFNSDCTCYRFSGPVKPMTP
ncbi:MAG TPA: hypothetical protein VFB78_18285 [Acidimicrobiales bacterium]|nr:hypothetical protein [Acidimicrobiales bacterium]